MRFSGGPKRRGIFFRILELPSITIKKNKHLFDKKLHKLTIVGVPWALVSIKSSFFFGTFFALFSILLGNYDGFGSMQSNIWCDFLLQFLSLFEEIKEFYMLRPLLGRSRGDVYWRLFAPASPSQFDETPRSHEKNLKFCFHVVYPR